MSELQNSLGGAIWEIRCKKQNYLAWFRYLDSKEYENTVTNKIQMLVSSCLFTVKEKNSMLRRSAFFC